MKVAILTLPPELNYGGILQGYALQTVLERFGHEVYILDTRKHWKLPIWRMPLAYAKRALLKYMLGYDINIFYERDRNKNYPMISKKINCFKDSFLHCKVVDFNRLEELKSNNFDAFVVGSDQVWRPKYFCAPIENAYLSFTEGWTVKRVAYAPSFGTDEWEYSRQQTKKCAAYLRKFDAISVREDSGIGLCRKYFNQEVDCVLDPTLLLTDSDYKLLLNDVKKRKKHKTLFSYILDDSEDKQKLITGVAEKYGLKLFEVSINKLSKEMQVQPGVEDWLLAISEAEFVVTDSFHACVFSIIFRKPFVVCANYARGAARLKSLLGMLHLGNRFINSFDEFDSSLLEIDYSGVDRILSRQRERSLNFIANALQK